MSKESQQMLRLAAQYSAVGIEIAACVGFGTWLGDWLDRKYGTHFFLWLGLVIGFGAATQAVLRVIKSIRQQARTSDDAKDKDRLN
jgi:F0F1-type ATP synthase assembly protein I